jgi:hypothetical protein
LTTTLLNELRTLEYGDGRLEWDLDDRTATAGRRRFRVYEYFSGYWVAEVARLTVDGATTEVINIGTGWDAMSAMTLCNLYARAVNS